jgi:hypothetical protein
MIKKAIFQILFIGVALMACAHQIPKNVSPLYDRFVEYRNTEKGSNNENQFFSSKLWSAIKETRAHSVKEQGLRKILLQFPNGIAQISGSKEVINDSKGCLMVMGTDNKDTPTDYYVSFTREGGQWVFDEIQIKYFLDGTQRFLKEAVCDEAKQNQLWIEFMR